MSQEKLPNPSARNSSILLAVGVMVLVGIIAGYLLVYAPKHQKDAHTDKMSEPITSVNMGNLAPNNTITIAPASKRNNETEDGSSDAPPPGSGSWFVEPEIGADFRYQSVPFIAIQWDGTCTDHPLYGISDMATLAMESASVDPADYFASDALPMQASQFWIEGDQYHQFGFKWDYNTPQTFTLEAYVSPLQSLDNAKRLNIDGFEVNQSHTYSKIREQLEKIVKKTPTAEYQRGARVGRYRSLSRQRPDQEPIYQFVSLNNSAVTAIEAGPLTCTSSQSLSKALCVCQEKTSP